MTATSTPPLATPRGIESSTRQRFAGTGRLLRFALRRERVRLAIWTLAIGLGTYASVVAVIDAYGNPAALEARASLAAAPGTVIIAGPLFGASAPTVGAIVANELFMFLLAVVAIMSILAAVRHTRADEEAGRIELLRALPVGRMSAPAAAFAYVAVLNLAVGAAIAVAIAAADLPVGGAILFGAACVVTGIHASAIAIVAAQLASHARAASGAAIAILGGGFLLRGVGDVANPEHGSALSWVSPLTWAVQTRVFADERTWPLVISLVTAGILLWAAAHLSARRDLGAGLIADPPGRPHAKRSLLSPWGLAWRLLRSSFAAWGSAIVVTAAISGSLAYAIDDMLKDAPDLAQWIGATDADLTDAFIVYLMGLLAALAATFGVSATMRLSSELREGRGGLVIVAGVSRTRFVGSWFALTVGLTVLTLVGSAAGLGIGAAASTGHGALFADALRAGLVLTPAVCAFVAWAFALAVGTSRYAPWGWLPLGWASVVLVLGEVLGLPEAAMRLSPIAYTPAVPAEPFQVAPLVVLGAMTIALTAWTMMRIGRRDLTA